MTRSCQAAYLKTFVMLSTGYGKILILAKVYTHFFRGHIHDISVTAILLVSYYFWPSISKVVLDEGYLSDIPPW